MTVLVMALAVLMKAVGCCSYAGVVGVDRILLLCALLLTIF